jgi:hypothetical protein
VKIGSVSAQILTLMCPGEHYDNRLDLLFDLSKALNKKSITLLLMLGRRCRHRTISAVANDR